MPRLNLTTLILLGLLLGILLGLFLGEYATFLEPVGDAYVRLLQMSVLPYIAVSLVIGVGRLSYVEAKTLSLKFLLFLFLIWAIGFIVLLSLPLAFPTMESASFFSSSVLQSKHELNFIEQYIPANPFNALANSIVPAVVLFSVAVGVALISVKDKAALLNTLTPFANAVSKITTFAVSLSPIGVFALSAVAAGTMTLEELQRLEVYFVTHIVGSLLLAFWFLPMLVSILTPFSYRDVVRTTQDALITGFVTSNLFIVLPMLVENTKELFKRHKLHNKEVDSATNVVIPVSYNFPTLGSVLYLLFLLYAAWFTGNPLSPAEYPAFSIMGLLSLFGSIQISLPYLLDYFRLPSDMIELYNITLVVIGRFAMMVAVMHVFVLAVLTTCSVTGQLTFKPGKLLFYAISSSLIIVITIFASYKFLNATVDRTYTKDDVFVGMHVQKDPLPATVHKDLSSIKPRLPATGESRLDLIHQQGSIRVGYIKDHLPYVFRNTSGQLVGYDVGMAHALARDLDVKLEFVPVELENMSQPLNEGYCDIVMSGITVTPKRLQQMSLSQSYMENTLAFIVRDHRRHEFSSAEALKKLDAPRIGIINVPYFIAKLQDFMPQAKLVPLKSPRPFFKKQGEDLDALLYSAEAGSAWSLLYPDYSVAIPQPAVVHTPLAYAMARNDPEMTRFINSWIDLKKQEKTTDKLYDYWILGKDAKQKQPRWSVIRDVLHWVD